VLASLPIEAESDGTVLVDANALLLRDAFDLLSQLRRPTRAVGGVMVREQSSKAADWRLDKDRSVIDLEHTASFPLNTEVEALLTFATDSESDLNQPDPHSLSVREHHSFLAMPAPGYEALEQTCEWDLLAASGFFQPYINPDALSSATPRLQKKDSIAALSEPVKPPCSISIALFRSRCVPRHGWAPCGGIRRLSRQDSKRTAHEDLPGRGPDGHAIPPSSGRTALDGDGPWPKPRRSAHG
jgi:hypothetical protein